ncbi:MAG TPA: hypothetical protein VMP11_15125 [Verrucomicrobiae bacterium]|nr:hypothetical protein [Verrucomicrobiae bacterium]
MPDAPTANSFEEQLKQLRRDRLKPLLHDIEISRAVEDSRPRDLYRLLLKKLKASSLTDRHLIGQLLSDRRLFAEPIKRPPRMHTHDGIGTSLWGKEEVDPADGSYIGTLFFVLLFLPIYPIAQYLVRPATLRGWYFLARVPLNRKMRLWRQMAALSVAVLACGTALGILYAKSRTNVYLVNGLDVPVAVSIDSGAPVQIAPNHERIAPKVSHGRHHIVTRSVNGDLVEEWDMDVPFAKDVVAYNILGAAPLYTEGVQYFAKGHPRPSSLAPNPQQEFCGQRFIVLSRVDYIFVSPPPEIKMEGERAVRWRFARDPGGWRKTLSMLDVKRESQQAAALAEQIARLEPGNEDAVAYGVEYVRAVHGINQAVALAKDLTQQSPSSLPAHRGFQTLMMTMGREQECRELYRKLAADHPGSPEFAYLRARVELPADAVKLYSDLVDQNPVDPYAQRGYAYALYLNRRFADAIPHFEKFAALAPSERDALLAEHAACLIAVGRTADAIRLVSTLCEQGMAEGTMDPLLLIYYGRLYRLNPTVAVPHSPEELLQLWERDETLRPEARAWFLYQTDPSELNDGLVESVTNADLHAAMAMTRAAMTGPDEALGIASTSSDVTLKQMDNTLLILLAAESQRRGNTQLSSRLLSNVNRVREGFAALKSNVLYNTESPELASLPLEYQAVVEFSKARQMNGDKDRARQLIALARQDDLLHGFVTVAAENWPH